MRKITVKMNYCNVKFIISHIGKVVVWSWKSHFPPAFIKKCLRKSGAPPGLTVTGWLYVLCFRGQERTRGRKHGLDRTGRAARSERACGCRGVRLGGSRERAHGHPVHIAAMAPGQEPGINTDRRGGLALATIPVRVRVIFLTTLHLNACKSGCRDSFRWLWRNSCLAHLITDSFNYPLGHLAGFVDPYQFRGMLRLCSH